MLQNYYGYTNISFIFDVVNDYVHLDNQKLKTQGV